MSNLLEIKSSYLILSMSYRHLKSTCIQFDSNQNITKHGSYRNTLPKKLLHNAANLHFNATRSLFYDKSL